MNNIHDKNENNTNDLKSILNILQTKTFKFVALFSCVGIFIIFAASLLNTPKNPYLDLANAINTFIGIIVGIVAMIMSIISLFFSFYNTKQSFDTHEDYLEKFINIKNSLDRTIDKQEDNIKEVINLSDKLSKLDSKLDSKFDKLQDSIHSLEEEKFNPMKNTNNWINIENDKW